VAFFNPTFAPQLVLRLAGAAALGAIFTLAFLLARREKVHFRRDALAVFGRVLFVGILLAGLAAWWYFDHVPQRLRTFAAYSVLTSRWSRDPWVLTTINALGGTILLVFAVAAARGWSTASRLMVVPSVVAALGMVAEFERIREFIRGPFLVPGYMYANQVLLDETPYLEQAGGAGQSYWHAARPSSSRPRRGELAFNRNCSACHTIDGVNGIAARVRGRSRDGIYVILGHTNEMIPFMPPFSGNDEDRRIVADFLFRLARHAEDAGAHLAGDAPR
jgi:mono/diheme cytochrome c family protein